MARYKVLEPSFIHERIIPAGEEIDYDGDPGPNLEPLDDEAREALRVYVEEKEPARRAKLEETYAGAGIIDNPEGFAEALTRMATEAATNAAVAAVAGIPRK